MGWASSIGEIFTGGIVQSIERVSLEYIQTDIESEEAKAIRIKALDPNGAMRREIMRFITRAYGAYLFLAGFLILTGSFGLLDTAATNAAFEMITATFLPVTGLFGTLATASFGINHSNNWKDTKLRNQSASS